jgi:hypothetical protein
VRECWLVDPAKRVVEIRWLASQRTQRRVYAGDTPIHSIVLPDWELSSSDIFG